MAKIKKQAPSLKKSGEVASMLKLHTEHSKASLMCEEIASAMQMLEAQYNEKKKELDEATKVRVDLAIKVQQAMAAQESESDSD